MAQIGFLPPGARGYLLGEQLEQQRQAQGIGQLSQLAQMQGALAQQRFLAQQQPLQLEVLREQVNQLKNPTAVKIDTGGALEFRNPRTNELLYSIPKTVTPDTQAKEAGDDRRSVLNPAVVAAKRDIAGAGAARNITQVNAFTPASEKAQEEFMKSTRATYDQLKHAPVLLENIEKAKALVPAAKGFMGTGGEPLLGAAKFLNNRLGTEIDTEGVKSAEELRSRIFFQVLDNLKKLDAQPSQQQQLIMQEALGRLGTDPNALPAILDAFGDAIRGKVDLHNREVTGASIKGVKFPYDPAIKLPAKVGGKTVKRTGTYQGKKVVEYTDGSIETVDGN